MPVAYRRASTIGIGARRRALLSSYALIGSSVLCLAGCSSAPSRNILGSYFPSWMICALIGLAATVAVRAVLAKAGIDGELPMPIVVYLALATAFSLAVWLLWLA
jgi:YtcA-like protein